MVRRNTNQRAIVYKALDELGHATMDKLIEYITKNNSDISLATIYRNVGILLEESQIKKVKLGDIEVLETVKEKHYHFKCLVCGEIYDIKQNEIPFGKRNVTSIDGNVVTDLDMVFVGTCKKCLKS